MGFIVPGVGDGGGGGTVTPIQSFTNTTQALAEADRDAYYTANPLELVDGAQCWIWWPDPPDSLDRQVYNLAGTVWISETSSVTVDVERHYQIAINIQLVDPPAGPVEGDIYVVAGLGGTATGLWATHEEEIATFTAGNWGFKTAHIGEIVYSQSDNRSYRYDETFTWVRTDLDTVYLRSNKTNRIRGVDHQAYANATDVGLAYSGLLTETELHLMDSVGLQHGIMRIDPGTPAIATMIADIFPVGYSVSVLPDAGNSFVATWNGTQWGTTQLHDADGTQFSSGEYAEWDVTTGEQPFELSDAWIQLVESASPFPDVTLDVTDVNFSWVNHVIPANPALNQRMMTPQTNDGLSTAQFRFTGASPGIQINFWWIGYKHVTDIEEYELRVGSSTGAVVETWVSNPVQQNAFVRNEASYTPTSDDVTNGYLDLVLVRTTNSINTANQMGVASYGFGVESVQPTKSVNTVAQFDSVTRGVMLPRILPSSSVTHEAGAVANDALSNNRLMQHDGDDWAYVNTTRVDFRSVDTGQFFFAQGNTFNDSGWTGSQHGRLVPTQDYQGFDHVIRCTQTGGTITIQAPNNTQALWDVARANGFRVDFRMLFASAFDGFVWMDIEPNNTSWGSNGRFEYNVGVTGGQLQVTMINSGGNTTFDIDFDTMYTISMVAGPLADTADILVNGSKVGEVTYGGGGTTDRGTFFYIPPGNPANDFSFQSITMYTLDAADRDVTLDRQAIMTGLRYNVPNINSPMTLRVPKNLYTFGTTFTIVNGSSDVTTVSGLADDGQLFGGGPSFEVLPQQEVTFTQTGFPLGNVWAVEGGKLIINHDDSVSTGNTLELTLDSTISASAPVGRHGNYLGDITVSVPQAGQYEIGVAGVIFDDQTTVTATARATSGLPRICNARVGGLGEVFVDIYDTAGTLVQDAAYVKISW